MTDHEPKEAPMGKTLAELNVQPGDVVACWNHGKNGTHFTIDAQWMEWIGRDNKWWSIVSRATPTRADLIAQRDALQAQIDALPPEPVVETVRLYYLTYNGKRQFNTDKWGLPTYYRDVTIIGGVPQGWTKIEGGE